MATPRAKKTWKLPYERPTTLFLNPEEAHQAYEGTSVPGFPNFVIVLGPYGYNGAFTSRWSRTRPATSSGRCDMPAGSGDPDRGHP